MAVISDERARLVAGQAERLRNDARHADELLRCGMIDQARELIAQNAAYAQAIWCELTYLTRPPQPPRVRRKSRSR